MDNALSKQHNLASILKFTAPTIIMMVFMSLYTMVDGVFVSRFVSTNALSAVNIVYPYINVIIAVAIMLATGSSAIIAKKMGEGNFEEARTNFSFITLLGVLVGIVLGGVSLIFLDPLLRLLGAEGVLYPLCWDYAVYLFPFAPLSILQMLFQYDFVAAGRPGLGLFVIVLGGVANIVLDYVFIVPLGMGIAGAAIATGIGYSIPAVFGLLYFSFYKKGTLYFVRPKFDEMVLLHSCTNGSSEMVTNLSMAVTTFLFNLLMLKYLGEDGVAAITIVLYAQFLLTALYLGYSSGISSVFSFNYGAGDHAQLQRLFRISLWIVSISSVFVFLFSLLCCDPIILIFAPRGTQVFALAKHGFLLFSFCYLFTGTNIFASAFFTALSNGKVSAAISFLRTFVFIVASMLLLPMALGVDGVWLAIPVAELLTIFFSVYFFLRYRNVYHYMK